MTKRPDIHRLIELHKLVLAFRAIERIVYIPGQGDLPENDVDHSYTLAMTAWYLAPFFPELQRDKMICLALAHDLVEVHSGDTSVFNDELTASKPDREAAARNKLIAEWPDFPELHTSLQEYVDLSSPEANFVYALDKIMPNIISFIGGGRSWQKHKITFDQLHKVKKDKVRAHPAIADYYQQLYNLLREHPSYFHQSPKPPSQQR